MGLVTTALAGMESLLSRVNAWWSAAPHLHPDRFAHPHEFDRLRSEGWQSETSLLIGVSSFQQALTVRTTPTRRQLGNILVSAPPRSGKSILAVSQLLTWPHSSIVLDIKGELYEQTAGYLRSRGHRVLVIDPTGVGHQFDPLHGRATERELYASAKYLLFEAGERDPIFIERGMKMLTQLFLAAREENRQAGFERYRPLPYALQLMDLPINQIAAHLHALSPALATKFLSGAYDPEKDYEEKRFLTSAWESVDARLYPIRSEEILRSFDGSEVTGAKIITAPTPQTWPTPPLPIWGVKPAREPLTSSENGNCHAGLRT